MSVPAEVIGPLFVRKLFAFSGWTFLVHDYLLTLSLELAHMWNGPWTSVRTLFVMNRYSTLFGQTFMMLEETGYVSRKSTSFCTAYALFLPFFAIISGESIRLLVVMRACAILGCKRAIALLLSSLYVLYAAVILGIVLYFFTHAGPLHFEYLEETGVCIAPAPPHLWTILFATLVLDSLILVLVFYSLYHKTKLSRAFSSSTLVRLLARDAILFYIATLFNSLLCIVCWTVFSLDPRNELQQLLSMPFLAVMGQRLVLNLRQLRDLTDPSSLRDTSHQVARQMAAMQISADVDTEVDMDTDVDAEWSGSGSGSGSGSDTTTVPHEVIELGPLDQRCAGIGKEEVVCV